MSKKKIVYLGYTLFLVFLFVWIVSAVSKPYVYSRGDYVYVSSDGAYKYYINTSSNSGTAREMNSPISLVNGTYFFWAQGTGYSSGNVGLVGPTRFTVTTSCSDQSKSSVIGETSVERCYIVDSRGNYGPYSSSAPVTCASGYHQAGDPTVKHNDCKSISVPAGGRRFCKVIYGFNCVKNETSTPAQPPTTPTTPTTPSTPSVPAATLDSLSVDGYSINPGFSSGTKNYSMSVDASVGSIRVSATASSGASFVGNFGPRTVNLNYGVNNVLVKVKNSAGVVTTYKIAVSRADGRSTDNTLKRLTIDNGTLSPAFSSSTTYYSVTVSDDVSTMGVGADLSDSNASFVEGYGPRTINLNPGLNTVYIKVQSEAGKAKVYTINVSKKIVSEDEEVCDLTGDELPLLKSLAIKGLESEEDEEESDEENEDVETDEVENKDNNIAIEGFSSDIREYDNIKVPYEMEDVEFDITVVNEGDTYVIKGNEGLIENDVTPIVIEVTSKACPTTKIEYTLNVTRAAKGNLSDEVIVNNIDLKGYEDEIDFESNVKEYTITVNKKEEGFEESDFIIDYEENGATYTFTKPDRFGVGSTYKIEFVSEAGGEPIVYEITIGKIKSGASSFLIIILIIALILVIIYFVLRMMGYRIYFNTSMIGAFFRGMGSKKDQFDK